jgi:hypothetical protein
MEHIHSRTLLRSVGNLEQLFTAIATYMVKIKRIMMDHGFLPTDSLHAGSPLLQRARPTLSFTTLPPPTIEQDTLRVHFFYRALSTATDCSWAACACCCCCCCPVRLSAAPSACVRMLNPRVFSMTDWYIGSAGRWIVMTFCRRIISPERVNMKRKVEEIMPFQGQSWRRQPSGCRG